MEALWLQDSTYVSDQYEALDECNQLQSSKLRTLDADTICNFISKASDEKCSELIHCHIVQRAKALDTKGSIPQWQKKVLVLDHILENLYALNKENSTITTVPNRAPKRLETNEAHAPVPFKELPLPTQLVLRMFFRACQSLRDATKLAANSRLSVHIASKLPAILTMLPPCILSPGLMNDLSLEGDSNVWSVFYQLFQLFEELLGLKDDDMDEKRSLKTSETWLSPTDRAIVEVAYVALGLKWGRLSYLLKGVKLLLENANKPCGRRFECILPLLGDLEAASIDRLQSSLEDEETSCGYLVSFGKGDHGKLGHGQCTHGTCQEGNCTENKMVPTILAATQDILFCKIDSLSTHSIAIATNGDVMAWGNGDKYRLGHGMSTKEYAPRTIEVLRLKGKVRDVACGLGHTLALMESGELFAWGNGANGRLGFGDTNDRSSPTKVALPTALPSAEANKDGNGANSTSSVRFRHIFCGASHSLGLSWDGKVYAWGKNNQGQCGHGHTSDQLIVQEIEDFCDSEEEGGGAECVVHAAGGWEHTVFCTRSGRVYSCGCGYKDSRRAGIPPVLGHGDCDRRLKPTLVLALEDTREEFVKVACGWDHSLAVSASGRVYTWGSGANGKLGHGDEESFDIPTFVRSMEGKRVKDAKAGCEHTVFLTHDYEVWTCGQGESGRLGHGDSQSRKWPTKIQAFAKSGQKPVALAVGDKYNLVLVKDEDAEDVEDGRESVRKRGYRVGGKGPREVSSQRGVKGLHSGQREKQQANEQTQFGARWVLNVAAGSYPKEIAATRSDRRVQHGFIPASTNDIALFIVGHIDRLASDCIIEETKRQEEKRYEPRWNDTRPKDHSVLLPYAVDTSVESLDALLQLLRCATSAESVKANFVQVETNASDSHNGLSLAIEERMGLTLSCLRILQLNLSKMQQPLTQTTLSMRSSLSKHSTLPDEFLRCIHELLDRLADSREEESFYHFEQGAQQSSDTTSLSSIGSAISHEAARALKMGFCLFYPSSLSRCKLLWELLNDCKMHHLSMRTVILSEQLCQDSVMTAIFQCLPSHGLLDSTNEDALGLENESIAGYNVFDLQRLMINLLRHCSAKAVKQLDDEALMNCARPPDCYLQLLHVLQTHYFSLVHHFVLGRNRKPRKNSSPSHACQQMMEALVAYVDELMAEALTVLKRLHTRSRQHEEIITWRLNGSFFHTLLPSAIECLSVLLLPVPDHEADACRNVVEQLNALMLLVERIVPNLHVMLKMVDEISWKIQSADDAGNQTHEEEDDVHTSSQASCQEGNWFVDLGDACAVLCGKFSCELLCLSQRSEMAMHDTMEHGNFHSLVLSKGRFLQEERHVVAPSNAPISSSIRTIVEWEHSGVYEVEDELDTCDVGPESNAWNVHDDQRFLLQLSDTDNAQCFWRWIATTLSHDEERTKETQRLLVLGAIVLSWHLGLAKDFRDAYQLYEAQVSQSLLPTEEFSTAPVGKGWKLFSALLDAAKEEPWARDAIESNAVENAIHKVRLLLSLQPDAALVPLTLQSRIDTNVVFASASVSLTDLFHFLTNPMDVATIQRSLSIKEVNATLKRTGICLLHDLLRKLTTSSVKSCLLHDFVAVWCVASSASSTLTRVMTLEVESDKGLSKAIENLFIRLARIISSDDASYELKTKALLAWTVPLSTAKQSDPSIVALIVKSGIVSTLIEQLLHQGNSLDTHNDMEEPLFATKHIHDWNNRSPGLTPSNHLVVNQTPAQLISLLSWEAFSSISLQLSRSRYFAQHSPLLLLRSGGSNLQKREPSTPQSASMSPRRRLTLPKKLVISSIDEIVKQMADGLFFMLEQVQERLEYLTALDDAYDAFLQSMEKLCERRERSSQVLLFGCPIQVSQSATQDIRILRLKQPDKSHECVTLSFWLYIEHVEASGHENLEEGSTRTTASTLAATSRSKDVVVRLLAFSADHGTSSGPQAAEDLSLLVTIKEVHSAHVSMEFSVRCTETSTESWCSVLVDTPIPQRKWSQVVLRFDAKELEHVQVFVRGRRSTVNNGQLSVQNWQQICSEILQKSPLWTMMRTGGGVDMEMLTKTQEKGTESNSQEPSTAFFKRSRRYGLSAVLDDVTLTHGRWTDEMILRMQSSGPILVHLEQRHVTESHCANLLWLLCQFVDREGESSDEAPFTDSSHSNRWTKLFVRMLLSTCRDEDIAPVFLCHLLKLVLPQGLPPPDFEAPKMLQSLFKFHAGQRAMSVDLFDELNRSEHFSATLSRPRECEASARMMQKHSSLHGVCSNFGGKLSKKTTFSMRFAASVHLIQTLCATPSWKNLFTWNSIAICPKVRGVEEGNILDIADTFAMVNAVAGYSEEVLNLHRVSVQTQPFFSAPFQTCKALFDSVIHLEDSSSHQVLHLQELIAAMMTKETQAALCLPARDEKISTCPDKIAATNARDQEIGASIYLYARTLRVVVAALLREQLSITLPKPWHHFLLENTATCDDMLRVASSRTKDLITAMLGPHAKVAMKLRRLRIFIDKMLHRSKYRERAPLTVSLAELEVLQWRLYEEKRAYHSFLLRVSWWQQSSGSTRDLTLEVVGGEVELRALKVKALEHFPTVRLTQAPISANSGLWFFEVVVLSDGLMQIGYVDGDFAADPLQGQGVGDFANSWAFDGFRCKKWNVNAFEYGDPWTTDDVVGVLLDTDRMDISYFLNGKSLGVAFSDIPMTCSSRMHPAVSLNVHQSVEFNFGALNVELSNEEGASTSCFGGFKHFPAFDHEDRLRLRSIITVLHTQSSAKTDYGIDREGDYDNWSCSNSSSNSDTDDGETLESDTREGHKASMSLQCRREVVEGLGDLGLPMEWTTRRDIETRLPIEEAGAVAGPLERIEQSGLNRPSIASFTSTTYEDGMEHSEQRNTPMQLSNPSVSHCANVLETQSSPITAFVSLDKVSLPSEICEQGSGSSSINVFIEGDREDQQRDDATAHEAFYSTSYRQRQINLQIELQLFGPPVTSKAEKIDSIGSSRFVDDSLPLSVAIDTTLLIAYTRQAFTTLLLLGLCKEKQHLVYEMTRRLALHEESSSHFFQFLRRAIGLDTKDVTFEIGFSTNRSLKLQQTLAALLQLEVENLSSEMECAEMQSDDRTPLFKSLYREMLSQCTRRLSLIRSKQTSKSIAESQSTAAWFAWVSGLVIGVIESQIASNMNTADRSFLDILSLCSTSFMENLVSIASSRSSASMAWKYVAFRMMTRILFLLRTSDAASTSDSERRSNLLAALASAQLTNLIEWFSLRYRRENDNHVFFSDITSSLFLLLVRSSSLDHRVLNQSQQRDPETHAIILHVDTYSSTHVTISWDPAPRSSNPDVNSDTTTTDDSIAEGKAPFDSTILFLEVKRCDLQDTADHDPIASSAKALPSQGTYTIRHLVPDTTYFLRLGPAQPQEVNATDPRNAPCVNGADLVFQTRPEPVFELDKETIGKNLILSNGNLTATNKINKKWHSVRAAVAFDEGVHRWQVRLDTCVSKNIFIGVCTAEACMDNYIGSDTHGYGFLANKAVWHNKTKLRSYGEIFKQGDVVEVTLDCDAKTLAFRYNGEDLGIAASNMHAGTRTDHSYNGENCKWYPAISMYNKDDKVTLIPPSETSILSAKLGRSQNASTLDLIEAMQDVIMYQRCNTEVSCSSKDLKFTQFFEKAFQAFDGYKRDEITFREVELGRVIALDTSKLATDKYGIATGDAVFTSKGQCTVLGEYQHELWYEIDDEFDSTLNETPTSIASWSLNACRDMLSSPEEYPIHRKHKEDNVIQDTQTAASTIETISFQTFVAAQYEWATNAVNVLEADAKLISNLDTMASSHTCISPTSLPFTDVSTALLLEKVDKIHSVDAEHGLHQKVNRIGLLLYVNRCLYNVVRLTMPRNVFATSLVPCENSKLQSNQPSSSQHTSTTECRQVSPVAALLNSPHWALDDPSAFNDMSVLAACLLFSSQKKKLIEEELRRTKTSSRTPDGSQETSETDSVEAEVPTIKIRYPMSQAVPFWESSGQMSSKTQHFHLSEASDTSVFIQLANQLTANDARQWRREFTQPFEAIPISQAFRVHVERPLVQTCGDVNLEQTDQQQHGEDECDERLEQPSSKQTAKYLKLFESAAREVQSPSVPLFTPVDGALARVQLSKDELCHTLELDVNLELFASSTIAKSRVRSSQVLLYYFCFGQLLGISWRSKVLLPLQFLSSSFWNELVVPMANDGSECKVREVAIRAVRDGLFSIVPSRCVALMSAGSLRLRDHLSDLDVDYVSRLERHATYSLPRQSHHDLLWKILRAFTSVERRMLEQFLSRHGTQQGEVISDSEKNSCFVLEIADTLADCQDPPDSCYPVIVSTGPHSSRLHLPAYTSAQMLRHKLLLAMTNLPFT